MKEILTNQYVELILVLTVLWAVMDGIPYLRIKYGHKIRRFFRAYKRR